MEDMTYDMAGSAAVVGLMKNLALRKAKIMPLVLLVLLKIWLVEMLKDLEILLNLIVEKLLKF